MTKKRSPSLTRKRFPSLTVPSIRLDPETYAVVRAEMQRIETETGDQQPGYSDFVRVLVRRALAVTHG